jgi:hypothetical protein
MASGGAGARREIGFRASGQPGGALTGVAGRDGTEVSLLPKLKAEVRSPTVLRRQVDRLGTGTPKRVSRNRSAEVWSKASEST